MTTCERLVQGWRAGWRNKPSVHEPALAIVEADSNDLIGQIGLTDRGDGVVELLYGIAPDRRRRGFASTSARVVAEWLLSESVARQVELRIDNENVASQRVALRAGFAPAGTVLSHVPATGVTYEDLRYVFPTS